MAESKARLPRTREDRRKEEEFNALELWKPKTEIGKKVKAGEITDIKEVIESGKRILESEIIDTLLPNLQTDFINIGQAKGKFGGGKRRIFRQTQKKTREGNKPVFTVMSVVGNGDGYFGVGTGTSKETLPSREKAVRKAKLNLMQIARGCGSWECTCGEPHTVPFEVKGKCGSVEVKLMPAPRGTGLVVDDEIKKLCRLAGIKDLWSKTKGQSRQKINFVKAFIKAMQRTTKVKADNPLIKRGSIV